MTCTLAIELRRARLPILVPLLAAVDLLLVLAGRDTDYWVGDWHATSIQVHFPVIALAPLLAGIAAYQAGRTHRHGFWVLEQGMPRPSYVVAFAQWCAVSLAGLTAYVAGVVAGAVWTAPAARGGGPWPSYLLLGAVALTGYAALGIAVGRAFPHRLAAPAAGLAVFGWLLALSMAPPPVARLGLVHGDLFVSPGLRLAPVVVAASIALGVVVVLSALASSELGRGRPRWVRLRQLAPLLAVPATALAAMAVAPDDLTPRPPADPYCAGGAPRVCTWPEHAKWALPGARVADQLARSLRGIYDFPAVVHEQGLADADPSGPALSLTTYPVTDVSLVNGLARGILPERPPACVIADAPRFRQYVVTRAWLQIQGAGVVGQDTHPDPNTLRDLVALPTQQQRAWIRQSLPATVDCSVPLPGPPA